MDTICDPTLLSVCSGEGDDCTVDFEVDAASPVTARNTTAFLSLLTNADTHLAPFEANAPLRLKGPCSWLSFTALPCSLQVDDAEDGCVLDFEDTAESAFADRFEYYFSESDAIRNHAPVGSPPKSRSSEI